jgi:hypothetical protein
MQQHLLHTSEIPTITRRSTIGYHLYIAESTFSRPNILLFPQNFTALTCSPGLTSCTGTYADLAMSVSARLLIWVELSAFIGVAHVDGSLDIYGSQVFDSAKCSVVKLSSCVRTTYAALFVLLLSACMVKEANISRCSTFYVFMSPVHHDLFLESGQQ